MPVTIVVGGQYGSEGKGKVTALTASLIDEPWVVRCGGPNSGHTTNVRGQEKVLRQLPAAAGHPSATLCLSAGCAIDEAVLLAELDYCQLPPERVIVDPRAVLIEDADKVAEQTIAESIGSTASGTGHALGRRMARKAGVRLASDSAKLEGRVRLESVAPLLDDQLDRGGDVIVEGTQGFGLSLLHGQPYPFLTSRDTTASSFASEVGLGPLQIDNVTLVIRTFPIRVGGRSGPLDELTWSDVRSFSGAQREHIEYTSVTGKVRRVGRFDIALIKAACRRNSANRIAIMGLDRLDIKNHQVSAYGQLTESAREFVALVQSATGVPVSWLGTGFGTFEAVRNEQGAPGNLLYA